MDPEAKIYKVTFAESTDPFKPTLRLWMADRLLTDNRILPKGFDETSYTFKMPKNAKGPLKVTVKLRYQSFAQEVDNFVLGEGAPTIPAVDMEVAETYISVK